VSDEVDDRAGEDPPPKRPSRRTFVIGGAALGAAGALASRARGMGGARRRAAAGRLGDTQARLLDDALATEASATASLNDIQHVVILMQENRSFDHYFGTLSGVRGFSDPAVPHQTVGGTSYPVFDQFGYQSGAGADPAGYLQPFHLLSDPPLENGQTTNDIAHDWGTQHRSWAGGGMNAFITSHLASDGAQNGPVTMGYYTRADLAFYYASPTPSRSATATTARCWARPTRTG
jgi:phospholipase C